ncbi:guanitoxin biosynthesis heme-dependent pre-guanitoxin N-hydroxylase GntA [Chryseolinea sp. T2]|uniref:guanitoxin biosynthesis heme-dependent pre-guanitoxin N-hydroxylase GntA n=1 Tax=Chryseolinea sp. T2 TaxID=3129255 RepID=UPI0030780E59
MTMEVNPAIEDYVGDLVRMVGQPAYPCVGAKAVLAKDNLRSLVVADMRSDEDDKRIINFLYEFIDMYRLSDGLLCSAAIIFQSPLHFTEADFDRCLWTRLQALADIDGDNFAYDLRVSDDPTARNFGFSIKSEALYVIGLHADSLRPARRFAHPAIVFNPHAQFEKLRSRGKYDSLKRAVRQRDMSYAGSVNPMLTDFGESSEAIQYSGIQNGNNWKCPFISRH